ncbi:PAS domain-containing sensor histidine kinase [Hymenobacter sp. BT730]|uniref:PAS domain-containing sensor histidine kinase n=1 Tax=Hymenobacter sp. BT730 TaxID=3063332 RepID=UPI0026DF3895|nr:PAS domain-containing sensor histidine kinase [Hymenobacter sp. BT730]
MHPHPDLFATLAAHDSVVYFCYRPADKQVLYVSDAYERELGGHVDKVNEELPHWLNLLHPDDRPYLTDCIHHAATGQLAEDVNLRLLNPDGSLRWLCLSAIGYVPDGAEATNGLLISGHVRDTTSSRNVLEVARRYQSKKNSMLEILSHDLASPLVLAQQMADYIAEKVEGLQDARLNAMISEMRIACQEGVSLIRDFVDQEFLDSSNVDVHLERLDLVERLNILLQNYQHREYAAGHHFQFQASHPSIYADIDENKFMQVLNNLLGNAIKFTPDGGFLSVTIAQQPTRVLLTVADTGIGIPVELQPELFERFTRARRPGLRGEKTTGLGMSIIKTIVELHDGRIWVESAEGQGTTFFIELPLPKAG